VKVIILLVVAAIVLTLVADSLRKRSKEKLRASDADAAERLVPADEAPPTETGRLRVKHIVEALKKSEEKTAEMAKNKEAASQTPEEEVLPDPFEKK